jgi:hypothetical protein
MAITGMPGKAVLFDPTLADEASLTPGMAGALSTGIAHGPNFVRPTASAVPGLDDTTAPVIAHHIGLTPAPAAGVDRFNAIVTDNAGAQTVAPTALKDVKFIDSTGTVVDGAAIQAQGYNNRSGVSIANGDRVLGVLT